MRSIRSCSSTYEKLGVPAAYEACAARRLSRVDAVVFDSVSVATTFKESGSPPRRGWCSVRSRKPCWLASAA